MSADQGKTVDCEVIVSAGQGKTVDCEVSVRGSKQDS